MKFTDAFEKVLKETTKENMPKGDDNIPKLLAFLWSMVAIAKNKLDDIAYISNNKIVSIPLQKSSTPKSTAKKGKIVGDKVKDKNGKEEKTTEKDIK